MKAQDYLRKLHDCPDDELRMLGIGDNWTVSCAGDAYVLAGLFRGNTSFEEFEHGGIRNHPPMIPDYKFWKFRYKPGTVTLTVDTEPFPKFEPNLCPEGGEEFLRIMEQYKSGVTLHPYQHSEWVRGGSVVELPGVCWRRAMAMVAEVVLEMLEKEEIHYCIPATQLIHIPAQLSDLVFWPE